MGSLADRKCVQGQRVSGILVKRNFSYHILTPSDLSSKWPPTFCCVKQSLPVLLHVSRGPQGLCPAIALRSWVRLLQITQTWPWAQWSRRRPSLLLDPSPCWSASCATWQVSLSICPLQVCLLITCVSNISVHDFNYTIHVSRFICEIHKDTLACVVIFFHQVAGLCWKGNTWIKDII